MLVFDIQMNIFWLHLFHDLVNKACLMHYQFNIAYGGHLVVSSNTTPIHVMIDTSVTVMPPLQFLESGGCFEKGCIGEVRQSK
jgi:hypothetical protein